eukprot:CCRYP_017001-RC/>CCRYP_017001-RC protein AED:0.47 eAED:1.00 QI:0/0/0/1/0/0/2/0/151
MENEGPSPPTSLSTVSFLPSGPFFASEPTASALDAAVLIPASMPSLVPLTIPPKVWLCCNVGDERTSIRSVFGPLPSLSLWLLVSLEEESCSVFKFSSNAIDEEEEEEEFPPSLTRDSSNGSVFASLVEFSIDSVTLGLSLRWGYFGGADS